MKKIKWVSLAGLILLLTTGFLKAADDVDDQGEKGPKAFEGEVDYSIFYKKIINVSTKFLISKHKLRTDSSVMGITGISITDFQKKKNYVLVPMQKTVYVSNLATGNDSGVTGSFTKSGKTDVILGHPVDEWLLQSGSVTGSFWMAHDMGSFGDANIKLMPGQKAKLPKEFKEMIKTGLFPLKVHYEDPSTGTFVYFEAIKIERKDLDPKLFEIPLDFQVVESATPIPSDFSSSPITITSPSALSIK